MNPADTVLGVLLTSPKIRAAVRALPTGSALRVRVYTPEGREILNLRASEVERTVIEAPATFEAGSGSLPVLAKFPGAIWFYGARGETIGFLPDAVLPDLARPGAVERPPQGPTTPRTLEGLQEALAAVLGGLDNLATYLESRARRAGDLERARRAAHTIKALTTWTRALYGDPGARSMVANAACDALERLLDLARGPAGNEESRAAALRFEPVAELARAVRDREAEAHARAL